MSASDVRAVGIQQSKSGRFGTLIEHFDGKKWSVVPSPNPGRFGNQLYGVAASGPSDVWAVGQRNDATSDTPLVERWDGRSWTVVSVPSAGLTGGLLQAVAVSGGQVWAVGQSDDAAHQAFPLVEHLSHGTWTATQPAGLGSGFSDINGVAVAGGTVWLVGEYLDAVTGLQHTLVARSTGSGGQQVPAPDPGTGDKTLGGISATGSAAWAVGYFKTDTGRSPLIEVREPR